MLVFSRGTFNADKLISSLTGFRPVSRGVAGEAVLKN